MKANIKLHEKLFNSLMSLGAAARLGAAQTDGAKPKRRHKKKKRVARKDKCPAHDGPLPEEQPEASPSSMAQTDRAATEPEIVLPPATDWRTTDEDEVNRRILRARTEKYGIRNLVPHEPVFSDFEVKSQSGLTYTVEILDIAHRRFHCDCVDFQVNGLGTCKHVEAVLQHLAATRKRELAHPEEFGNLGQIILFADIAHRTLKVAPETLSMIPASLRERFDATGSCIVRSSDEIERIVSLFHSFFPSVPSPRTLPPAVTPAPGSRALTFKTILRISQSVTTLREKFVRDEKRFALRREYEQKVRSGEFPPQETLVPLYPYQREGMLHLVFAGRAMLADEMGLGKTIQAIAACALLHRVGQARHVLVVTPVSLKAEWEEQIRRFTTLPLQVVMGNRKQRLAGYANAPFFTLVNYEQMLADSLDVNAILKPDIVILDEAQRIKNWASKTAQAVKRLKSEFAFVLTGTPLENRLDELYSIVSFLDPSVFGSLFRFNREFYDLDNRGRPTHCRNLSEIHDRIRPLLLRRRKSDVETELPDRTDRNLFVPLSEKQQDEYDFHKDYVARLLAISVKRPLSIKEQEKLLLKLSMMRMVCDTNYILDKSPKPDKTCPKLVELERILEDVFDSGDPTAKVIVFSEWTRMLELVREYLQKNSIGFAWHTGSVPQAKRRKEIRLFKDDPKCRVFLSTDSGGVGLNLQNASVVINCDLPWNPAKLEQRIARAWRKHQRKPVTVINLVADQTIEHAMLGTLANKQALADGVLNSENKLEKVPLHQGGQSFFKRLEQVMARLETIKSSAGNTAPNTAGASGSVGVTDLSDPGVAFSKFVANRLGARIVSCEEQYPNIIGTGATPVPPVLLVVVDADAKTLRPKIEELRAELFSGAVSAGAPVTPPRIEVIDRAMAVALDQLREAGVIQTTVRGTRQLYSAENGGDVSANTKPPPVPLSDVELNRIKEHRQQSAKRVRLAKVFAVEEFFDDALSSLRTSALELIRAIAVEKRIPPPKTIDSAILSDFSAHLSIEFLDTLKKLASIHASELASEMPALVKIFNGK
jgi:hypothetical protein